MSLVDSDYMLTAEFQFTRMVVSFNKGTEKRRKKINKRRKKEGGGGRD